MTLSLQTKKVDLYTYSKLLANQFSGSYQTKEDMMATYLKVVRQLVAKFYSISITQKPKYNI